MRKWMKIIAVAGVSALALFTGCSDNPADGGKGDEAGPTLSIDTVRAGGVVLGLSDSATSDTVSLKGKVSDPSGVKSVLIKLLNNVDGATVSSGAWSGQVLLRSGINNVVVTAADEEGNETEKGKVIYFKTNYFPLSDSSYWKFQGTQTFDSVTFAITRAVTVLGIKQYRFQVTNSIQADTTFYLLDFGNAYKMNSDTNQLLISEDTLFLKQYTPSVTSYDGKATRFVTQDTTLGLATYRNCVVVTFPTALAIKGVTRCILSPYKGLVGIEANAKSYALYSHRP
jgi:hypothetical protein